MKTVIKNISELIQVEETTKKGCRSDMTQLQTIKDAFVEMEGGIITAFAAWTNGSVLTIGTIPKSLMQMTVWFFLLIVTAIPPCFCS